MQCFFVKSVNQGAFPSAMVMYVVCIEVWKDCSVSHGAIWMTRPAVIDAYWSMTAGWSPSSPPVLLRSRRLSDRSMAAFVDRCVIIFLRDLFEGASCFMQLQIFFQSGFWKPRVRHHSCIEFQECHELQHASSKATCCETTWNLVKCCCLWTWKSLAVGRCEQVRKS